MADRYHEFKEILSRHDLHISRRRVIQHLESVSQGEDAEHLVLPAPPSTPAASFNPNPVLSQLDQALSSLDDTLITLRSSGNRDTGRNGDS